MMRQCTTLLKETLHSDRMYWREAAPEHNQHNRSPLVYLFTFWGDFSFHLPPFHFCLSKEVSSTPYLPLSSTHFVEPEKQLWHILQPLLAVQCYLQLSVSATDSVHHDCWDGFKSKPPRPCCTCPIVSFGFLQKQLCPWIWDKVISSLSSFIWSYTS